MNESPPPQPVRRTPLKLWLPFIGEPFLSSSAKLFSGNERLVRAYTGLFNRKLCTFVFDYAETKISYRCCEVARLNVLKRLF